MRYCQSCFFTDSLSALYAESCFCRIMMIYCFSAGPNEEDLGHKRTLMENVRASLPNKKYILKCVLARSKRSPSILRPSGGS